jgi:hypothetical protein
MHHSYLHAALLATGLALGGAAHAAQACGDIGAELATMASVDQAIRGRIDFLDEGSAAQRKLYEQMALVDRTNTQRLKAILARCGWPSKQHGERAPHDAWLLAQHADHDLAFQKKVLALIEEAAAASGEALDRNFAYLYDRVAVAEKRPQRYGTQMIAPDSKPCALDFAPFDDRAKVDERRARLNLPPLESYRRMGLEMAHCPVAGIPATSHYPQAD